MVISRTPFRISFFGGGTDYPAWYLGRRGKVISTTIDKYCYITTRFLSPLFSYRYRIRYADHEERNNISEIKHPSVRECLRFCSLEDSRIEMQHNGDLPAMSGLGSSSAFTVGFLHALRALTEKPIDKHGLAKDAIHVEQNIIKENVGSQDQVAAAFGGLNVIEFGEGGFVVRPVKIPGEALSEFARHLMLFYTGSPRIASEIAAEQIKNIPGKSRELDHMLAIADEADKILSGGQGFLDKFGDLLDESWKIKRTLALKITNSSIDDIYHKAKSAGARGAKLLGAGGGGFLLVYADPEYHQRISSGLSGLPLVEFNFESSGSQIVYKTGQT